MQAYGRAFIAGDEDVTQPTPARKKLEERVAFAWAEQMAFLRRLVDEGEMSVEDAELLMSERGKRTWLLAFIQGDRGY